MILGASLALTLVTGTLCQEIILGPPTLLTPCTSKSRAGKDRFVFTGTIGQDVQQIIAAGWQNLMFIIAFEPPVVDFRELCRMELKVPACDTNHNERCTCVYRLRQIHFVVNYSLDVYHSRKSMGVIWSHNSIDNKYVLSDKNYSLPEICDVNTAHLTLTIAGALSFLPTIRDCFFSLALRRSNLMQLCCSNMAMPCYSRISFRGVVVASDESPCVTYAPTVDGVTAPLQLSYSVCTKTEYRQGNNCTIRRGVVTTRVPPPTTAVVTTRIRAPTAGVVTTRVGEPATDIDIPEYSETTSGVLTPEFSEPTSDGYATTTKAPTTVQPSSGKSNTLQILFWAALLLILLVIICALVTLWIILRRKKEQDEIRESVRGSLSKTAEVEPPEEVEEPESIESASTVSKLESEV